MPQAPSTRWCPTPEQLMILEEMYRSGVRTPTASQIQQITAHLSFYGRIEGKNVFYWFQNHKARDRQKLRRRLSRHHHLLYSCSNPHSLRRLEETFLRPPLPPPLPFHRPTLPHFLHQLPLTSSSSSSSPLCHCFSVGTFFRLLTCMMLMLTLSLATIIRLVHIFLPSLLVYI